MRDVETFKKAHPECLEKFEDVIEIVSLDIIDKEQILSAVKKAGDIDLLINNAGIANYTGLIAGSNLDSARQEMEVNYFGTLSMIRAFAPVLGKNGGGAIFSHYATPTINYTTFWNNNVDIEEGSNGGGIYCEDGSAMTIINSILWDNAGNTHAEIYFESIVEDTLFTIDYSVIKGGFTGDENLNIDPLFEDTNKDNFHLQENSPCIGTTSTTDPYDQMGAYGGVFGENW